VSLFVRFQKQTAAAEGVLKEAAHEPD